MYYDRDRNTQAHSPWELYDLNAALWPRPRGLEREVAQRVEGILAALEAQDRTSHVRTPFLADSWLVNTALILGR